MAALSIFLTREYSMIHERFFNKNLSVFVLDVGQGNAALIEAPGGKKGTYGWGRIFQFVNL